MAGTVEKWRKRGVFATSVTIKNKGGSGGFRSTQGFINNSNGGTFTTGVAAGTLALTLNGTSIAGTEALLDLTAHRLRLPVQATAVGGNSIGFGTVDGGGGSAGQIRLGYTAASAQMGLCINGTVWTVEWPVAGGAVVAIRGAAGA